MKTYLSILNNERGGMAALLSVIVLSLIMVTTLTSFYTYIENRAKFQERVRQNYQFGYVMEDMSRAITESHELYDKNSGVCPAGTAVRYLDCTPVCMKKTASYAGVISSDTPSDYAVCVKGG